MKNYLLFFRNNFKIILEYKASFIIQSITMLISNTSFFLVWYFVFQKFGTFSGFNFNDYLLLFSSLLLNFSFAHIFFWWYNNIASWITNWTLDNFLLMPWNVLIKLLAYGIPNSIFWDLLNALLLPLFIPWFTFILFLKLVYFSIIWSLVFLWFMIFMMSLSFYIWSSRELTRAVFDLILWPWNYPEKIYEWTFLKILFVTVVPVYYTFFLPFNLIRNFEINWFIILHLSALFFMWLWIITFNRWLKRYESWNLINTNS